MNHCLDEQITSTSPPNLTCSGRLGGLSSVGLDRTGSDQKRKGARLVLPHTRLEFGSAEEFAERSRKAMLQLRAAGRRGGDSIRSSWAAALRKSPHPHHPHHRAFLHTSPSRNVLGWFSRRKDPKTDNSDVTPEKPSEPKQLDGEEEEASITHQGDDPADTYTPSTYPPLEEGWSIPDSQDTAYQSTAVHHLDLTDAALPFPYGISDFPTIREQNKVYVDQTQFIPVLERLGPASMYLRPDHWGKTTLATTLRAYYDRNISETAWKQLFRGLHATGRPDIHHMVAADPDLGPIFGSMTEAELNEYLQRPRHVDPEVETEGMSLKQGSTLTPEQKEVLDYSTEKKHRPAIHALAQQTSISPQSISDSAIKEWLGYKQRLRDGMDAWIHARAHNPTATQGEYVPYLPPEASAMSRTAAVPEGQLSVTPDARQYAVLTLVSLFYSLGLLPTSFGDLECTCRIHSSVCARRTSGLNWKSQRGSEV